MFTVKLGNFVSTQSWAVLPFKMFECVSKFILWSHIGAKCIHFSVRLMLQGFYSIRERKDP